MGSVEGDFDAWLEIELARDLGSIQHAVPNRDWVRSRPRLRRLTLSAGGAIAVKAVTGMAVAVFAVGATGTAMTGSPNPTAWGQAIEEVASAAVPVRFEETPSQPAGAPGSTLPGTAPTPAAAGSSARHEQRPEAHATVSRHPVPTHNPNPGHRGKPTPKPEGQQSEQGNDQHDNGQGDGAWPRPSASPSPSSGARIESHD